MDAKRDRPAARRLGHGALRPLPGALPGPAARRRLLPALCAWARAEWVHVVFLGFAAPVAGLALLRPVCGCPPPAGMLTLGGLGILGLAVGAFGPQAFDTAVTVAGSGCLVTAHLWNWRRRDHVRSPTAD
jgi:hypothetical protein